MQGTTERIPWSARDTYEEHHCPKNMSLHLVDDARDVWMCECNSPFLYFPLNDSCYEAYRQGPCPSKNYLVLLKNETMPRCVKNRCLQDGLVPYNDACYPLQTIPCNPYLLELNVTIFQLKCMPLRPHYLNFFDDIPTRNCPSGSRRSLKSEACIKVQARHN